MERLKHIARRSAALMAALHAGRSLGLSAWCIGAGAVRNQVWNDLHARGPDQRLGEVDLVYFDADSPPERDAEIQACLNATSTAMVWDVTNQAHVHRWYQQAFGRAVPPLLSLEDGVATWPEFATCVGLCLLPDGELSVIAPHGLDDLFGLLLRYNPLRASPEVFRSRCFSKGWLTRWPLLRVSNERLAGLPTQVGSDDGECST